jgi:raffinose/stachyose/melibiose transport system permease protein
VIGALKVFAPVYWITGGGPIGATTVPSLYAFNAIYGGDQVPFGAAVATAFTLIVGVLAALLVRVQRDSEVA